jgi:hypothetical protein
MTTDEMLAVIRTYGELEHWNNHKYPYQEMTLKITKSEQYHAYGCADTYGGVVTDMYHDIKRRMSNTIDNIYERRAGAKR